jgi:hypothetical protein
LVAELTKLVEKEKSDERIARENAAKDVVAEGNSSSCSI